MIHIGKKKRKRKKHTTNIGYIISFVSLLILLLFYLSVKKLFGILFMMAIVIGLFAFFCPFFQALIKKAIKMEEKKNKKPKNCSITFAFIYGLRAILQIIKRNGVYAVILVIPCASFPCAALAAVIPVGPPLYPIKIDLSLATVSEAYVSEDNMGMIEKSNGLKVKMDQMEQLQEVQKLHERDSIAEVDDTSPVLREMKLEDPYRKITLSDTERRELLFLDGDWKISNDDISNSKEIVHDFINNKKMRQRADSFSFDASENLKNDVSIASNTDIWTSCDLDAVLAVHEGAWDLGYDNFTLTKLISNSYYGYGLAYFDRGFVPVTAESYLLISIKWRFRALEYAEPDQDQTKQLLANISQAYCDISLIDGLDSDDREQAKLLSEVFKNIKESY